MKKLFITIGFILFLAALPIFSQDSKKNDKADSAKSKSQTEQTRRDLYARWEKSKKDKPAEAYKIAVEYVEKFPDDKSENARILKKWLEDYEKTAENNSSAANEEKSKSGGKSETDAPLNVAGTWLIMVPTQQGDLQFTLKLEQDGENLKGVVESAYGNGTVTSGTIIGNVIKLVLESNPFKVNLNATVGDEKMEGTVKDENQAIPELQFLGTRPKKE